MRAPVQIPFGIAHRLRAMNAQVLAPSASSDPPTGLTADEVLARQRRFGSNVVPDETVHAWRSALSKLWATVPWMLEITIGLQWVLGKYVEAGIIAALLVFNA